MAVKSSLNYRDIIYPDYKANRRNKPDTNYNYFVPIIRQMAIDEGLAIEAVGREADDMLRIWAVEAQKEGDEHIICSIDKDLKCIPGKYFNVKSNELQVIEPLEATRFYYEQLLKGDSTDNIPGIPKVGEVKAKKMLSSGCTEEDFRRLVAAAYYDYYDDAWKDYLLANGKMIYLQGHEDDYFEISSWGIEFASSTPQEVPTVSAGAATGIGGWLPPGSAENKRPGKCTTLNFKIPGV
jgi:hypothetical protein